MNWRRIRGAFFAIAFIICVFFYLIIESIDNCLLRGILIIGPSLVSYTLWLLARSMFNDHPLSSRRLAFYTMLTVVAYYSLYYLGSFEHLSRYTNITGRGISIFFLLLAVMESQSGKKMDLDHSRLKFRKYFIYSIGVIVLLTLLSELGLVGAQQELPRIVQRSAILIFNTAFIMITTTLKSPLFDVQRKQSEIKNPDIIDRIQSCMVDEKLYRKEKLTIGQLADHLEEQEYKIRAVINQEMGYRNFLDFTNSYRIREATSLLRDSANSKLTILEVAYKVGFNSIGPFNRVFKQFTGRTPTEYRNG